MIFLLLALQCIFILPTRIQCVIETPKSVFLVGSKVPCVDCCTKEVKSMKVGEPLKNVCHEVISSKKSFWAVVTELLETHYSISDGARLCHILF